ncbi:FAD-binding oxidoreductase [Streptomyces sp. DSM 40750]|uniref:FAD-binding oxidoreductase n=1 Tax=Streptomyces sp. DSM 40750 TaxID=2801030 RepID=UPI003FA6D350
MAGVPGHRSRAGRHDGRLQLRRPASSDIPDAAWQAAGDIFTTALRLGGTLTGEHGVGTLKRRWVAQELGSEQHAPQQRIKAAFDPHHILNPGKAL